jgi:hypothetical protein
MDDAVGDAATAAPFGAWPSPFAIELLTKGSVQFA